MAGSPLLTVEEMVVIRDKTYYLGMPSDLAMIGEGAKAQRKKDMEWFEARGLGAKTQHKKDVEWLEARGYEEYRKNWLVFCILIDVWQDFKKGKWIV